MDKIFLTLCLTCLPVLPVLVESETNMTYFAPSLFLNHGGGPNPVLGVTSNMEIAKALREVKNYVDLKRLNAIVIITAHREEDVVTISSGERHDLIYDYYNFPPESYTLKYNAPGHPELAREIHEALITAGIKSRLDDQRGWDHGVFIPMLLINPDADIPIIQVSILRNQNAKDHYELGKALYQFREKGVAIIGSGLSYHNMAEFRKAKSRNDGKIANEEFHEFLTQVCMNPERKEDILKWESVPGGYESHPLGNADHLMPLIVNIGASGDSPCQKLATSIFVGKFIISNFFWG